MKLPAILDWRLASTRHTGQPQCADRQGAESHEEFAFYCDPDVTESKKWVRLSEKFPIVAQAFDDLHALCPWFEKVVVTSEIFGTRTVRFALMPTSEFQYESDPRLTVSIRRVGLSVFWQPGLLYADMIVDDAPRLRFAGAGYTLGGLDILKGHEAHQERVARELFDKAVRDRIIAKRPGSTDVSNHDVRNFMSISLDGASNRQLTHELG